MSTPSIELPASAFEQAQSEQARSEQARSEQARSEQARSERARSEQARSEQARSCDGQSDGLRAPYDGQSEGVRAPYDGCATPEGEWPVVGSFYGRRYEYQRRKWSAMECCCCVWLASAVLFTLVVLMVGPFVCGRIALQKHPLPPRSSLRGGRGATMASVAAAVSTKDGSRLMLPPARRVAIVAGSHGDELAGPWTLRQLGRDPLLAGRPSFGAAELVIGNPKAYQVKRRFVDEDLDVQFAGDLASEPLEPSYEGERARALNGRLGPKGSATAVDFILDLHTSTSAMGVTLIADEWSLLGLAVAACSQQRLQPQVDAGELPEVRIAVRPGAKGASPHLVSLAREALTVEVGPLAPNLLRADVSRWMGSAANMALDCIDAFNNEDIGWSPPATASVYIDLGVKVKAPKGADGLPGAVVHEALQGRDFQPLKEGDPIFTGVDGRDTVYDGKHGDIVWPIFINEAGDYASKSGLGFALTREGEIPVPRVAVATPPPQEANASAI